MFGDELKAILIGGGIGLCVGGLTGSAIAGLWGGVVGSIAGIIVGGLTLGILNVGVRSLDREEHPEEDVSESEPIEKSDS